MDVTGQLLQHANAAARHFQRSLAPLCQAPGAANLSHPPTEKRSASSTDGRVDAAILQLQQLLAAHHELLMQLGSVATDTPMHAISSASDDAQIAARRQAALQQALPTLDAVACSLRDMLDEVHDELPPVIGPPPDPADVIAFAHRIRYTTFAGMGMLSAEPAPQLMHMSCSTLWAMGDTLKREELMQRREAERRKAAEAAAEERQARLLQQAAAAAAAAAAGGAAAPALPAMPPGWKPGDPIDVAALMPANWKPGDPLPFPMAPVVLPAGQEGFDIGPVMQATVTRGGAPPVAPRKKMAFDLGSESESELSSSSSESEDGSESAEMKG